MSQRIRKRIEESLRLDQEAVGGQERTKFRGRGRVRMGLHLRSRHLQSGSAAEASGSLGLKAPANCRLIGRWRIVESGSLGSSSSRSERPGDADDHRARRRNRLRRLGGRPRSRIRPRLDRFPLGRMRGKAMRSRAKEPPNCSTRGRSRSSSPTKTATKRSSKQNETLLQQPASLQQGSQECRNHGTRVCGSPLPVRRSKATR